MSKIIFLDFDGVLIPLSPDGPPASAEAIGNLNLLVQLTEAKVVVTSNWRNGRSVEQLEALPKSWGYKWSVLGKTQDSDGSRGVDEDRGELVESWLATNGPVDAFVIIDDDRTTLEHLAANLVSPSPDKGLQMHDVAEAMHVLLSATKV